MGRTSSEPGTWTWAPDQAITVEMTAVMRNSSKKRVNGSGSLLPTFSMVFRTRSVALGFSGDFPEGSALPEWLLACSLALEFTGVT